MRVIFLYPFIEGIFLYVLKPNGFSMAPESIYNTFEDIYYNFVHKIFVYSL